jgi:uncharacterized protein
VSFRFIAAVLIPAAASALHAASFDCSKARTLPERTICSDPKLSAADDEMAALYKAALAGNARLLLTAQELKADQVAWLTLFQMRCKNAACLSASYRDRIRTLKNIGDTAPAPVPARVTVVDESLGDAGAFPQIHSSSFHPGVELFNSVVRRLVMEMRRQFGASKVDFNFETSLLGGRVASSYARIAAATGGAHPMPVRLVVNVDLNLIKEIALADLFAPRSAYFALLSRLTLADLKRQSDAYGWEGEAKKDLFDDFTFSESGLVIHFPPYVAGSYADGDLEVMLSLDQLRGVARSGGLLTALWK